MRKSGAELNFAVKKGGYWHLWGAQHIENISWFFLSLIILYIAQLCFPSIFFKTQKTVVESQQRALLLFTDTNPDKWVDANYEMRMCDTC